MKLETMHSGIFSLLRRAPFAGIVTLTCVFAFAPLSGGAGNIFDDDWTPPKPAVQPHAAPAQPPPAVPVPPAPATNPAAAPPPPAQPAPQPQPAPAPQPPARHAIPGKLEQAHSRGLLKDAFAAQLKDRTVAGRRKLAQALLDEVPKTADNPSDEYVLLGGAIDASKDAGALDLCSQAADTMASQYEVDGLSIKIDAALKMNLRGDSPAAAAQNVQAALALIDPLLAAEEFSTAARILTAARRAASDSALTSAIQKQLQIVESLRAAHDRVAVSAEKLKTSPDDPAANLAVGSHLCFSRGEWEKGLILLTRGSDANLKQLANLELSRPKTADDAIRLADGWWDLAPRQPEPIRSSIRQHAAFFYKLALKGETGLRKTLLEHRIAEAAMAPAAPATGTVSFDDTVSVTCRSEQGYVVGPVAKGTTLVLQYVSGTWKSWGARATENPDADQQERGDHCRLAIADNSDKRRPSTVLSVVPAGTSHTPYSWVSDRNVTNLILRINDTGNWASFPDGTVRYHLKVIPPVR